MTPQISLLVWSFLVLLLLVIMSRCRHAWEFVDKTEPISKLEEAKKNGINVAYMSDFRIQEMSKKVVIIVIRCPKCGTAKVLRESN